jgi:murein DD-endopeptidase MepM/ murein hydrolase activator NlpD
MTALEFPITAPPIDAADFLAQSAGDDEYLRARGQGMKHDYVAIDGDTGKHCHAAFDWQAHRDGELYASGDGECVHVDFGKALGRHQFVIRAANGTGALYCHTRTRPEKGRAVVAGERLGVKQSDDGQVSGPHLHNPMLRVWDDLRSAYNAGPQWRALQAAMRRGEKPWEKGDDVTEEDLEKIKETLRGEIRDIVHAEVRDAVRAAVAAIVYGSNNDKTDWIPDNDPRWKTGAFPNLSRIGETGHHPPG